MATKPKVRSDKAKAAKKPKVQDKEQSERFIETARAVGADESGKKFEKVFSKAVKARKT